MTRWTICRWIAAVRTPTSAIIFCLLGPMAGGQAISVLPVNVLLGPEQMATTLSVSNQGNRETAVQVRAFAWSQEDGTDHLTESDELVVSPPIATIAPGASQVVRLILRKSAQGRESTYRIFVDQIPPPAEPGVVHVVLRLSIPVFVKPATRTAPDVRFHLEHEGEQLVLVGINDGLRHAVIRNILLRTSDGRELKEEPSASPYILAGATRRWRLVGQGSGSFPLSSQPLRLTAKGDTGAIDQTIVPDASR
jgi:fimbrial chaperone protein